jgi:hypothetical protein
VSATQCPTDLFLTFVFPLKCKPVNAFKDSPLFYIRLISTHFEFMLFGRACQSPLSEGKLQCGLYQQALIIKEMKNLMITG